MLRLTIRSGFKSLLSLQCARLPISMSSMTSTSQTITLRGKRALWTANASVCGRTPWCMFSAQRSYSKEEKKPTDPEKLSQEIDELKEQIQKLKQRQSPPVVDSESSDKSSDEVQIDITDRQIGDSDEELNLYRLAYDFPGFKSKNIRVTISDNLLKIYAFQTAGKKSDAHKDKPTEYIYEHTNEEILPDQVSVDMVSASFDAENGFLVIEAILPDDVPAEQVLADTRKRNELLSKTQEQIEKKQKLLQSLLARETEPPPSTASSTKD